MSSNKIYKDKNIFCLQIAKIKSGLENPTSKATYEKANVLVEKCSKIGFNVLKYVVALGYIFPKVIISFFNYFTTDLGNGAFDLPILMW